jgi:L-cysteine desulfidase
MERHSPIYQSYIKILGRELVPAIGCTEPVAVAYCAAKARAALGEIPDRIEVEASGNIVKNVKSVMIPNTGGCRGIAAAAAIGVLAGDETKGLEVIANVPEERKAALKDYMKSTKIVTRPVESDYLLDITVTVHRGESWAKSRTLNEHANIVCVEKNGRVLERKEVLNSAGSSVPDYYALLTVKDICDFAETVAIEDVRSILDRQIALNTAISDEGMKNDYGANIGKVLLKTYGSDVKIRAKAVAAAGSDARMNGCELPVVINSGSGNQGMAASLPVIEYAKALDVDREKLYRALVISNLVTVHQKTGIGPLSAYCGAVSAGTGAGAGIAYLCSGGDFKTVTHTIVNALAVTSGIICDGAKSSCAAKIAVAVDAGIMGYEMYCNGQQFRGGDGVVVKGVENTIKNIGRLGKVGMRETDREIIRMMTEPE